jgi:endoglucanase
MDLRTRGRVILLSVLFVVLVTMPDAVAAKPPGTGGLYVPPPHPGAVAQIEDLIESGDADGAELIERMAGVPQAVWIEQGTPEEARDEVRTVVKDAKRQRALPVFVAYNIPGRDCANLSAGGALTTEAYTAWIDGFANGIGGDPAIVILEPDGLGLLPSNCPPMPDYPFTDEQRYEELNYAVDRFAALPHASVYLDATHSAWLGVREISTRLLRAGVERADGFFVNVSNHQFTPNLVQYGTWISQCLALGEAAECPDQYWNGGPPGTMIADLLGPWTGVALDRYGIWSDDSTDPALNTSGINQRYADALGSTEPSTRFVIDTSRNGLGPWDPPDGVYSDPQDWCNPPDRGLGARPTLATGLPLVDAYLWVKTPGESDGTCTRGAAPGSVDPEWGIVDPAAGRWFPEQALELATLADPPLE